MNDGDGALLADRTVMHRATNKQARHEQKHDEALGGDSEHCSDQQRTVDTCRIQFVFRCQVRSSKEYSPAMPRTVRDSRTTDTA